MHRIILSYATCVIVSLLTVLSTPLHLLGQYQPANQPLEALKTGFDSITNQRVKELLEVLVSFEGRGTGQVGYTKAAHWVAGKIAEYGLEPIGERGTYFQMVPMVRRTPEMSQCQIRGPEGLLIQGEGNIGFERFSDQPEVSGQVVFLNINGENPAMPDDLEIRDKIVIYTTDESASRRAPWAIRRKQPAAALRVIETTPKSITQVTFSSGRRRSGGISGTIGAAAAAKIVKACGGSADWLDVSKAIGVTVHSTDKDLAIAVRVREEKAGAPNVIGWLQGSDPEVNDEYVVIGAHLDHLGKRGSRVYPGADDNGSGSAAVLSIAHALSTNPVKPRRSVLFIWFTGEEMGLRGSRYYCDNPIKPLEKMTCMLNMDMVGRNEETQNETAEENEGHLHLIGSRRGNSELHQIILDANQHIGFEFEFDQESVFGRSDQINFYRKGVPVAFLFGGFHPDYHQPSDLISEINYQKIAMAARLFYVTIHMAAEHGRFQMTPASDDRGN